MARVWLIIAEVTNELGCEIWLSIIKSYSFRRQFRTSILNRFLCSFVGNIGCYYGNFPCKFGEVWLMWILRSWFNTATIIKEIVVKFDEYYKSYSFKRQFRRHFSTVFHVIFEVTIRWYYGNFPVNLRSFD